MAFALFRGTFRLSVGARTALDSEWRKTVRLLVLRLPKNRARTTAKTKIKMNIELIIIGGTNSILLWDTIPNGDESIFSKPELNHLKLKWKRRTENERGAKRKICEIEFQTAYHRDEVVGDGEDNEKFVFLVPRFVAYIRIHYAIRWFWQWCQLALVHRNMLYEIALTANYLVWCDVPGIPQTTMCLAFVCALCNIVRCAAANVLQQIKTIRQHISLCFFSSSFIFLHRFVRRPNAPLYGMPPIRIANVCSSNQHISIHNIVFYKIEIGTVAVRRARTTQSPVLRMLHFYYYIVYSHLYWNGGREREREKKIYAFYGARLC